MAGVIGSLSGLMHVPGWKGAKFVDLDRLREMQKSGGVFDFRQRVSSGRNGLVEASGRVADIDPSTGFFTVSELQGGRETGRRVDLDIDLGVMSRPVAA